MAQRETGVSRSSSGSARRASRVNTGVRRRRRGGGLSLVLLNPPYLFQFHLSLLGTGCVEHRMEQAPRNGARFLGVEDET